MNPTRVFLYFVGVGLVLVSLWMLFFQTNLDRWIPVGIAIAAMLLILGLAIMSLGDKGGRGRDVHERVEHVEHHDTGGHRHT